MLLAGDIGGTKTVLALYTAERGHTDPLVTRRYPSGNYDSLYTIITEFIASVDERPTRATFGVAGPIFDRQTTLTNLSWHISEEELMSRFDFTNARLLNDLAAIGHAVPILPPDDFVAVNDCPPVEHGTIAVMAPGTGLGEAFLVWKGGRYRSLASEGGHKTFGPVTEQHAALVSYLLPRVGHVSYERVCSGKGIPNLYDFLRDSGRYEEPAWLRDELAAASDRTPIIVDHGRNGTSAICRAAVDLFIEVLASEAGNLALQVLATGGVVIGGGIPPRLTKQLTTGDRFMRFFTGKGRFAKFLDTVSVRVINNPSAAILGAAHYGLHLMPAFRPSP